MATKRTRGNSIEYIITNKKMLAHLPRGRKSFSYPLEDEARADKHIAYLEEQLRLGRLPDVFHQDIEKSGLNLAELIRDYMQNMDIKQDDVGLLTRTAIKYGQFLLSELTYDWIEDFIAEKKRVEHLSPSTIKKYVGALSRCLNWAVNKKYMKTNPAGNLHKGYAQYTQRDEQFVPKKINVERDRRLSKDGQEEARIRAVLAGELGNIETTYRAAYEFMFIAAIESAMRMREIYTLTFDQIDLKKRTIFLEKTKNGNKRQVPMTTVLCQAFLDYQQHLAMGTNGMEHKYTHECVFPFWNGSLDQVYLRAVTSMLSTKFRRVFKMAQVDDFRFHDLRHEAVSRIFERTELHEMKIMKMTGHSSMEMLKRYANLRASDTAELLW